MFFCRTFPLNIALPEWFDVPTTWTCRVEGATDRILSVNEKIHNVPKLPTFVRGIWGTITSTGLLTVTNW